MFVEMDEGHASRLRTAIQECAYPSSREWQSALFLLTSDETLWKRLAEFVEYSAIDFSAMRDIGYSISGESQRIIRTAQDVFSCDCIKLHDLLSLSDEAYRLILHAFFIRRFGWPLAGGVHV